LSGSLMGLIVLVTVLLALTLGIGFSYAAAYAIFRAMSPKPEHQAAPPLSRPAEAGGGN